MRISAKQGGFTLIELVVVITILGILAAFAIPRFVGMEVQARTASRDALAGSVRSGAALAHALWLANGSNGADVTMEGNIVAIVNGYPSAAAIDDTLASLSGYTYTPAATSGVFASESLATCTVTYAEPAAVNTAPVITAGGTC
jgi:MSHA pilin protein MshA